MTVRPRLAAGAVCGVLACLTVVLGSGPRSVPVRTVQSPASPEPPLAGTPPAAPPANTATLEPGAACVEDPPTPVVAIRVRAPATVAPGQEIEYRICVENRSNAAAHHVLVRNPLPAKARFARAKPEPSAKTPELLWQLGTIEGGTCREIVLVLEPTEPGDVQNCARVQFEHGQCVRTAIARPALKVQKSGPARAFLNETLTYQLSVTNTGSVEAANVVLADTLPAALVHSSGQTTLRWELGTLGPGQSRCVEYPVTARAAGKHCNRALATATGGLRDEVESCVTIAEARLSLAVTGPARRYVNLPAAFQITVTNPGGERLENVAIVNPLPGQTTFVRAGQGGQLSGNEVQWLLGALEPGGSRTVELVWRSQAAGRICNRARALAEGGVTAQAEACADFVGVSALSLEVADTDYDPIEVGGEARYVILVRNQGSAPASNVIVEAVAPEEIAVVRVAGPADHRKEGQRILFNPFALQPQGEARFVVHGKAMKAGFVLFKVDLRADQLESGPVHEEESTNIYGTGDRNE